MNKFIKKVATQIICKVYKIPSSCTLSRRIKIKNTTLEGANKIGNDVYMKDSQVGFGTYICPNTRITACKIGKYGQVGFEALCGAHPLHKVVSIHPALYSARGQSGFTYVNKTCFEEYKFADPEHHHRIVIGNDVWVTPGTTKIVQGVTIGDGAIVLEGAVVTKNVPPYAIVGGIPARIVDYRFNKEQIDFLLNLKWWDKGESWIKDHSEYFSDIDLLMEKLKDCNDTKQSD